MSATATNTKASKRAAKRERVFVASMKHQKDIDRKHAEIMAAKLEALQEQHFQEQYKSLLLSEIPSVHESLAASFDALVAQNRGHNPRRMWGLLEIAREQGGITLTPKHVVWAMGYTGAALKKIIASLVQHTPATDSFWGSAALWKSLLDHVDNNHSLVLLAGSTNNQFPSRLNKAPFTDALLDPARRHLYRYVKLQE